MDGEEISFSSPKEEIEYWKNLSIEYKQSLDESREELDEFQQNSRELEAELEAQLEQAEGRIKDLESTNSCLMMNNESLRERYEAQHTSAHKQITELEDDYAQVKAYKDELQRYIRELEQANDDLERAKRATVVSLEDFETRLNQAIERNAFLENELDEKETLNETIQRLKDEGRDLRQELAVTQRQPTNQKLKKPESVPEKLSSDLVDSNKINNSQEPVKDLNNSQLPCTPVKSSFSHNNIVGSGSAQYSGSGSSLTPSARISALNIVGDLLRKVGTLESKLAHCRKFVREQPRSLNKSATPNSSTDSPRAKRLHRAKTETTPDKLSEDVIAEKLPERVIGAQSTTAIREGYPINL